MVLLGASNLLLVQVICGLISYGCSRPQDHTALNQQTDRELRKCEAEGHFKKDIKQLNLPESKRTYNELENDGSGNDVFRFATSSFSRSEASEMKNAGIGNNNQVVRRYYQIKTINASGSLTIKKIGYVADENGFHPFIITMTFKLPTNYTPRPSPPPSPMDDISF